MMMTTQFFNSGGNNVMFPGANNSGHNNSSISKTIAKAKLR